MEKYVVEMLEKCKFCLFYYEIEIGFIKFLVEFIWFEIWFIIIGDNYDVVVMLGIVCELGWEIYFVGKC